MSASLKRQFEVRGVIAHRLKSKTCAFALIDGNGKIYGDKIAYVNETYAMDAAQRYANENALCIRYQFTDQIFPNQ